MENRIYYNILYDYYGTLFTETQKKYFEAYYFNNLSLTEIAADFNVTKNAISKTLKEVISKLAYYETNLHLYQNKAKIKKLLDATEFEKIAAYL